MQVPPQQLYLRDPATATSVQPTPEPYRCLSAPRRGDRHERPSRGPGGVIGRPVERVTVISRLAAGLRSSAGGPLARPFPNLRPLWSESAAITTLFDHSYEPGRPLRTV